MTQEDKDILIKDLCGRLPYKVKGIITYNGDKDIFTVKGIFNILFLSDTECCKVEDFKPYLRPMSSMTEEEREKYIRMLCKVGFTEFHKTADKILDFLYKNHFDCRGLIKKGLAIEAPEGMYN